MTGVQTWLFRSCLVDLYKNLDSAPKYHNVVFLDIECEIAGALTVENIKNPKGKITSVALYDCTLKKYYCLILDESKKLSHVVEENKEIIHFLVKKHY